jgi:hypothetical protein
MSDDTLKMILQVSEVILVLLLSVIIVLVIPKVREIKKNTVKTALYIFLGLILFILVGMGYNVIQEIGPAGQDPSLAILSPYTQFFPLLILSIALAGIILVTYMEGERYGLIMAGTAFSAMLPDILKFTSSGRFDLFLLGCVIWALIPIIWVLLFRRLVLDDSTMRERIWAAVSASLISFLIYVCTAVVAVFGETKQTTGTDVVAAIGSNSDKILGFVVVSLWFYILLTVIIVSLMFVVHDLALHTFNINRIVRNRKEIIYRSSHPVEGIVKEITPKVDAYKGLVEEMRVFSQYLDKVDRLRAASTIARFKQEYLTLAARHTEGSKAEAEQIIKLIDQEFKNKYR